MTVPVIGSDIILQEVGHSEN